MPLVKNFVVQSPNVSYTDSEIVSDFSYETTRVDMSAEPARVVPSTKKYKFKTERKVPKLGYAFFSIFRSFGRTSPFSAAMCSHLRFPANLLFVAPVL